MPGSIPDTGRRAENEIDKVHASWSWYSGVAQSSRMQKDMTSDKCYGNNKRAQGDREWWAVFQKGLSAKTFFRSFEQINKKSMDQLYQREIRKNDKYEKHYWDDSCETKQPSITTSHNSPINVQQCPTCPHFLSCPIRHGIALYWKKWPVLNQYLSQKQIAEREWTQNCDMRKEVLLHHIPHRSFPHNPPYPASISSSNSFSPSASTKEESVNVF